MPRLINNVLFIYCNIITYTNAPTIEILERMFDFSSDQQFYDNSCLFTRYFIKKRLSIIHKKEDTTSMYLYASLSRQYDINLSDKIKHMYFERIERDVCNNFNRLSYKAACADFAYCKPNLIMECVEVIDPITPLYANIIDNVSLEDFDRIVSVLNKESLDLKTYIENYHENFIILISH